MDINCKDFTAEEYYILARFMYRIGYRICEDVDYDALEKELKNKYKTDTTSLFSNDDKSITKYLERSYDDDPIPYDLLGRAMTTEQMNMLLRGVDLGSSEDTSIVNDVSKSMKAYRTLDEAYDWITSNKQYEFCISPKIDGINTTSAYHLAGGHRVLKYTRTRGRSGRHFDITANARYVLPIAVDTDEDLTIAGEAIYPSEDLHVLNEALEYSGDDTIVTPRGGALSALRRSNLNAEVYEYLKIFVFRCNLGKSFADGLDIASKLGFLVVPHEVYKFSYTTKQEYEKELTDLIWKYKTKMDAMNIATDGIVLQINDRTVSIDMQTNTLHDGDNLAVKALAWEPGIYTSRIRSFIMKNSTSQFCCKALIDPVYTESGKKLSVVNLYNPETLITNGLKVGSLIEINYKNETTINFLRKLE